MRVRTRPATAFRDKDGCRLVVPVALGSRFGLSGKERIMVRFGRLQDLVSVALTSEDAHAWLEVPGGRSSPIPAGQELVLGLGGEGELRLGPLMGVITTHAAGRPPVTATLGPQNASLRGLALAGRRLGAVVQVFGPEGVNWRRHAVTGYVLRPGGATWRLARLPFPDVVYNRIPTRSAERRPQARLVCRRLQAVLGRRFFNPGFLDKWQVYRLLGRQPDTARYVPITVPYRGWRVAQMLKRHPAVYLKPPGGSLGLGIIRVDRTDGRFRIRQQRRPGRIRSLAARDPAGLRRLLRSLVGRRRYLLQQGVDLATFEGRSFDVRALAQKDGRGQWTVTGMAARVARRGGIATHVPNGGTREPVPRVLREGFGPEEARRILVELEQVARTVAAAVETGCGRALGELSLDLAVDRRGRVWVLEANAKPFRFDEDAIRERAWARLVLYGRHLIGFQPLLDDGEEASRQPDGGAAPW